jgi:hypothetical protein
MASNLDLFEFNYEIDEISQEHPYAVSDVQWIGINDLNNGSYANQFINFSNLNMVGASPEKFLDFSQAYIAVPITVTLNGNNCGFGVVETVAANKVTAAYDAPENACAVGLKPFHHIFDSLFAKFGGIQINRNSQYLNFYINEQLKKMTGEEYALWGDVLNYNLDNADSVNYQTDANGSFVFEQNNNLIGNNPAANAYLTTIGSASTLSTRPYNAINDGHLKRMQRLNSDLYSNPAAGGIVNANPITLSGMNSGNISDCFQSCYLGATGWTDATKAIANQLAWTYMVTFPLAKLCDFYQQLPTINSASQFEIKLQLNLGTVLNNWTYNFSFATNAVATAKTVVYNNALTSQSVQASQSVGHSCPLIISQAGHNSGSGLSVFPLAAVNSAQACSVTAQAIIGYNQTTTTLNSVMPCRIYVPIINYAPSLSSAILKSKPFKMLYRDYYVDQILNQSQGSQIVRLYNVQLNRPRTMYILPFISAQNATNMNVTKNSVVQYQQCTSSAPTTVAPCRIKNVQINIGGSPIFINPLYYNTEFYNNNILNMIGKINGNSLKSKFFSGLITKQMWEKSYGVYMFNLEKVDNVITDNAPKSFQIQFNVESVGGSNVSINYDFIVLVDYEIEMYIDRASGQITTNQA